MRRILGCASLLLVLSLGCGASPQEFAARRAKVAATGESFASTKAPLPESMAGREAGLVAYRVEPAQVPSGGTDHPANAAGLTRRIIYDAELSVVVEDFARAEPEIRPLVESAGGYVAEQSLLGSPGSQRSARWKVRVPAERLETFRDAVKRLGEVERDTLTSSDVTEQYYDVEARIKNKQVEEETLVTLLKERSGLLEDILKVEMELSRVRGEIEQMQGRLRVLANLSSLATATLHLREREKYEPAPPAAPDFATTVGRTFQHSLDRLVDTGKAVVLFLVAIALWIPLILVGLLLGWSLLRRLVRLTARSAWRAWELARTPSLPPSSP